MAQGFAKGRTVNAGNGIAQVFVNGVKQASTSGSDIDFTIPSGVKEFKVTFDGVSTTGVVEIQFQLGDAGGVETTDYDSGGSNFVNFTGSTTGFTFYNNTAATSRFAGVMSFVLHDAATNTWCASGIFSDRTVGAQNFMLAGSKSLSGELTTLRVTVGSDSFDAGSINVQYDNPNPTVGWETDNTVVQTVHSTDGELATSALSTPAFDDTIPQSTEGFEVMTCSITPTSSTNKLKIEVTCFVSNSLTGDQTVALFQDSTADALATAQDASGNAAKVAAITFTHWMTAGTTSSTTFKVRAGASGGTTTFNGESGSRGAGGSMASSITITEYAA